MFYEREWFACFYFPDSYDVGAFFPSIARSMIVRTRWISFGTLSPCSIGPCPHTNTSASSATIRSNVESHCCQSLTLPPSRFGKYRLTTLSPQKRTRSAGTNTQRFVGVCPGVSKTSALRFPRLNFISDVIL